jgi:hypothetical protein
MTTMPVDIERLKDENSKSLLAVSNSITRLLDLSDDGLPLSEAIAVNTQLARAQGDKIHLLIVGGHLGAAGVIVKEMDANVQARLDELAARLDKAILDDFKLHAALDLIRVALSAAEEISSITEQHLT